VRGYAAALERLDTQLPQLESLLRPGDVAIMTADHGCDPTAPGSDHTREYVPYLAFGNVVPAALGTVSGLDFVGVTMATVLARQEGSPLLLGNPA
jgi:phosphopentomutase